MTGLPDARAIAGRFGQTRLDGEWLVVDSIADEAVPALVAELVARGGAVHAVVPARHTLEERFLSLLAAAPDGRHGTAPDAAPDAAAPGAGRDAGPDTAAPGSQEARP